MTKNNQIVLSGAACCMVSALAYTMANVCMKQLSALHCDSLWAVFNRELVTSALVGPWLIYRAMRGQPVLAWGRTLAQLLAVGVLIQVVGNVGVQWAIGVVGLAVTVPVVYTACIVGGALLGRAYLGEPVSRRSLAAIGLLFASLIVLAIGAERAGSAIAFASSPVTPLLLALGVAAAAVAGATFSLLNIVIRFSFARATPSSAVVFLIPFTGVVSLGIISLFRADVPPSLGPPWQQFALMAGAGLFNLVGFTSLIYGLQRTTIVHANAISASQVAMAALAGVLLFHEPKTMWLAMGICLTIVGVLGIDRPAESPDL